MVKTNQTFKRDKCNDWSTVHSVIKMAFRAVALVLLVHVPLKHAADTQEQNKKLIRRWDSESELFTTTSCTYYTRL